MYIALTILAFLIIANFIDFKFNIPLLNSCIGYVNFGMIVFITLSVFGHFYFS
jgi:hypothetical protein